MNDKTVMIHNMSDKQFITPFTGENIVLLMVTIIPVTGIYIPICFDTMFADVNNSSSSSLKQLFELIIHT